MPCKIVLISEAPFSYSDTNGLGLILEKAGFSNEVMKNMPAFSIMPENPKKQAKNLSPWLSHTKTQKHIPDAELLFNSWVSPAFKLRAEGLLETLSTFPPDTIFVPLGATAFWLLTSLESVAKHRGSRLQTAPNRFLQNYLVIGTQTIREMNANLDLRPLILRDFQRIHLESLRGGIAFQVPLKDERIAPNYAEVLAYLETLIEKAKTQKIPLSVDIETKSNTILCVGLSTDSQSALCIPFWKDSSLGELVDIPSSPKQRWQIRAALENPELRIATRYFTKNEENKIVFRLRTLFLSPNTLLIGQNLQFEFEFFSHYWFCRPAAFFDTMVAQHVLLPGTPKNLGHLQSLYGAEYTYWKDDGKFWEDDATMNYPQLWRYNCKDVLNTFEIYEKQVKALANANMQSQFEEQILRLNNFAWIMYRGTRINHALQGALLRELISTIGALETRVAYLAGRPLNVKSPPQLSTFFYSEAALPIQLNPVTKAPTTDDEALRALGDLEPLFKPITSAINSIRSLATAVTAISSQPDPWTKRFHSAFNTAGAETFRCSSARNAWKQGMNMQNATSGKAILGTTLCLPNVRTLFIADFGFTNVDMDLDRADVQVVAWEADDETLIAALQQNADLHLINASEVFNLGLSFEDCLPTNPNLKELAAKYKPDRDKAKAFCHATNYGAKGKRIASVLGLTVAEGDRLVSRYLEIRPKIKKWQDRTLESLTRIRSVQNVYGYKRIFNGRVDALLPQALAWVPQSTVAIVIDRIMVKIIDDVREEAQVLSQVHDSLYLQVETQNLNENLLKIKKAANAIIVPYQRPLIIPSSFKVSAESWGNVKDFHVQ